MSQKPKKSILPWSRNRDAIVGTYNHLMKAVKEQDKKQQDRVTRLLETFSRSIEAQSKHVDTLLQRVAVLEAILDEEMQAKKTKEEAERLARFEEQRKALDKQVTTGLPG